MYQSVDQLKRKLRQLKRVELAIRFQHRPPPPNPALVWNTFFSTHEKHQAVPKYSLPQLSQMDHAALKAVFEEYFYHVYFQTYKENGLAAVDLHDPQLLALLALPPYAGMAEIKKRFRDLAKRYHPDAGGDHEKFIELLGIYEKLSGE